MRILIVDDDYTSRLKLQVLFASYGDCDAIANVGIALEMFKVAHEEMFPYDLIAIAVDMPGVSGQETVEQIREWESENSALKEAADVKILMVSSQAESTNISSSFLERCDGFIEKPFTSEKIRKNMEMLKFI